jgi:hypothetical protein
MARLDIGKNEVFQKIISTIWLKKIGSRIFTVMKLKHLVNLSLDNPGADFWIVRRGNANQVGRPTREYSPEHIGVSVTRPDLVLADYLYYLFEFMASNGVFAQLAQGTTGLKSISVKDLKNIPLRTS